MKKLIISIIELLARHRILTVKDVIKLRYFYKFHSCINFKHPKDINEKINWLKIYSDTSLWEICADKYTVRQYVTDCGFGNNLVELYAKWDKSEDIKWDCLPNQFVMKTNNGSGDVVICRAKSKLEKKAIIKHFQKCLGKTFGIVTAEPHYAKMKPCIIVEELLDSSSQPCHSRSLVDYKIYCCDGEPLFFWCCYNRKQFTADVGVYDTNWNYHPEYSKFGAHYRKSTELVPKPKCFEEMMNMARALSEKFPFVRVDLYEVNGKVYFGEMTFAPSAGFIDFHTTEFLNMLGERTTLPMDRKV